MDKPEDYVIGTGEIHTVRDFCEAAFAHVGLNWKDYIETDPKFLRPIETAPLRADNTKARTKLGWEPQVKFKELVKIMVDHEIKQ